MAMHIADEATPDTSFSFSHKADNTPETRPGISPVPTKVHDIRENTARAPLATGLYDSDHSTTE